VSEPRNEKEDKYLKCEGSWQIRIYKKTGEKLKKVRYRKVKKPETRQEEIRSKIRKEE